MSGQQPRRSSPLDAAIAQVIRAERAARNMNRADLVKASGVPLSTLRNIDTGARAATVPDAEAIAHAFGWSLSQLIRRAEERMTSEDESSEITRHG